MVTITALARGKAFFELLFIAPKCSSRMPISPIRSRSGQGNSPARRRDRESVHEPDPGVVKAIVVILCMNVIAVLPVGNYKTASKIPTLPRGNPAQSSAGHKLFGLMS